MRQETFGPIKPVNPAKASPEAAAPTSEAKPTAEKAAVIDSERTPERAEDGQEKGSADRKGASSQHLKSVSA